MPDEIDIGEGVTAEFVASVGGGEFYLTDVLAADEPIVMSSDAARKFCRFVEEKAGKP